MFDPRSLTEPIVQAPMAGGPSTPELAVAVSGVGGLGFLAAGYKRAEVVREEISTVRATTAAPFGVNLFVPSPAPADPASLSEYLKALEPEAERYGVALGEPRYEDDDWERKLELVLDERVAVVSLAFGCPGPELVDRLHGAGIAVWVTITSPAEAVQAQVAGADALVLQGTEAGGHRGGFTDDANAGLGLLALLRIVAAAVPVPLIATGGIADGAGVAAVLCAGASAVQVGTALMLAPEAGTNEAHRRRLRQPVPTALTRAFTGRLARGIVNRFMVEHSDGAPIAYPEIHHVTSPLRAIARSREDADGFNLWAGQAHELAEPLPAAEIVRTMGADARRVLQDAGPAGQ
jgi:nitronate monooxygenase